MSWKGADSYLQEKLNKRKELALALERNLPISKLFLAAINK